jgi:hypothetical protein
MLAKNQATSLRRSCLSCLLFSCETRYQGLRVRYYSRLYGQYVTLNRSDSHQLCVHLEHDSQTTEENISCQLLSRHIGSYIQLLALFK